MIYEQIELALVASFEDFKLSQSEKFELSELMKNYQGNAEAFNFARNRAFKLVTATKDSQENYTKSLKWLEHIIRGLDSIRHIKRASNEAFFSPGSHCANRIISLIQQAKECLDICVFTISDDNITKALLQAYAKGIKLRIITDNDKSLDLGSDIAVFTNEGINLRMDDTSNHMHHKFAIFDNNILVNGSFNWTRSASRDNHENIMVISDKDLVSRFSKTFEGLWKEFA